MQVARPMVPKGEEDQERDGASEIATPFQGQIQQRPHSDQRNLVMNKGPKPPSKSDSESKVCGCETAKF